MSKGMANGPCRIVQLSRSGWHASVAGDGIRTISRLTEKGRFTPFVILVLKICHARADMCTHEFIDRSPPPPTGMPCGQRIASRTCQWRCGRIHVSRRWSRSRSRRRTIRWQQHAFRITPSSRLVDAEAVADSDACTLCNRTGVEHWAAGRQSQTGQPRTRRLYFACGDDHTGSTGGMVRTSVATGDF